MSMLNIFLCFVILNQNHFIGIHIYTNRPKACTIFGGVAAVGASYFVNTFNKQTNNQQTHFSFNHLKTHKHSYIGGVTKAANGRLDSIFHKARVVDVLVFSFIGKVFDSHRNTMETTGFGFRFYSFSAERNDTDSHTFER